MDNVYTQIYVCHVILLTASFSPSFCANPDTAYCSVSERHTFFFYKEKDEKNYFIVKRMEHISSRFSNSDIQGLIEK